MTVFRITPRQTTNLQPFDVPELRVKGTGQTSELDLLPTLQELRQAILNKYSNLAARNLDTRVSFKAGYDSIQCDTKALGDNRDTIYLRTKNFLLPSQPDSFVIVFGANHVTTGKALYSNFSVYGRRALNGVGSVDNTSFPTAEQFLPGNPNAKYFYVYKIARQCRANEDCLAIRTGPGAAGIPLNQPAFVAFRAYLEVQTKVGPEFEELLYDQAIEFSPRRPDPEPISQPPDLDDDEDEDELSDEGFTAK